MRRFIADITDTISTRLGRNADGRVVISPATLPLRALSDAWLVLTRLAGLMPGSLQVAMKRRVQLVGVAGAANALEHYGSSCWRSPGVRRPVEPVGGATPIGF